MDIELIVNKLTSVINHRFGFSADATIGYDVDVNNDKKTATGADIRVLRRKCLIGPKEYLGAIGVNSDGIYLHHFENESWLIDCIKENNWEKYVKR